MITESKCFKTITDGKEKILSQVNSTESESTAAFTAAAITTLFHLRAVFASSKPSTIPDNHIGLSNSLWLTLICFAARREYTATMSLCSRALVPRLMASERIQLRG